MTRKTKTILTITGIILVIALIIGWCAWRQHETKAQAETAASAPATSATTEPSSSPPAEENTATESTLTDKEKMSIASKFEHAARDWGVDPADIMSESIALKTTADALNPIRMPSTLNSNSLDEVSSIERSASWGPNAQPQYCREGTEGMCANYPTQISYWHANEWTMGARIKGVTTTMNDDGTVNVKGTVHVAMWSWPEGAVGVNVSGTDYWGYSPMEGTVDFNDTLTIGDDGKVSKKNGNGSVWIADPFFTSWDNNPADDASTWDNRNQINLPIKGTLPNAMSGGLDGISPDISRVLLKNSTDTSSDYWQNIPGWETTGDAGISDEDRQKIIEEAKKAREAQGN